MARTTVYLQLRPRWRSYTDERLEGFDVKGVTKNRPQRSAGPVVKLTLVIPDQAFMSLRPEVVINIPEQALDFTPVVKVELPDIPAPQHDTYCESEWEGSAGVYTPCGCADRALEPDGQGEDFRPEHLDDDDG